MTEIRVGSKRSSLGSNDNDEGPDSVNNPYKRPKLQPQSVNTMQLLPSIIYEFLVLVKKSENPDPDDRLDIKQEKFIDDVKEEITECPNQSNEKEISGIIIKKESLEESNKISEIFDEKRNIKLLNTEELNKLLTCKSSAGDSAQYLEEIKFPTNETVMGVQKETTLNTKTNFIHFENLIYVNVDIENHKLKEGHKMSEIFEEKGNIKQLNTEEFNKLLIHKSSIEDSTHNMEELKLLTDDTEIEVQNYTILDAKTNFINFENLINVDIDNENDSLKEEHTISEFFDEKRNIQLLNTEEFNESLIHISSAEDSDHSLGELFLLPDENEIELQKDTTLNTNTIFINFENLIYVDIDFNNDYLKEDSVQSQEELNFSTDKTEMSICSSVQKQITFNPKSSINFENLQKETQKKHGTIKEENIAKKFTLAENISNNSVENNISNTDNLFLLPNKKELLNILQKKCLNGISKIPSSKPHSCTCKYCLHVSNLPRDKWAVNNLLRNIMDRNQITRIEQNKLILSSCDICKRSKNPNSKSVCECNSTRHTKRQRYDKPAIVKRNIIKKKYNYKYSSH